MPDRLTQAPLVGAHFHPPAKALLAAMRVGQSLRLEREPQNPYDSNAIQVFVRVEDLPDSFAPDEAELAGYGYTLDEITGNEFGSWMLGHIAAKTGEAAALAPLLDAGESPKATLAFNMNGAPIVRLEWGASAQKGASQ